MRMTVQDVAKQQQNTGSYGDLCKTNLYVIITAVHPTMTNTDIVRTLALKPVQIALLKLATPQDVALAFNLKMDTACKSTTLKEIIDYLTQKDIPYLANNDTLAKLGKQVHMTVSEMASLLRKTPTSLLLTPVIETDLLRREIGERKIIEEKVTRMEGFAMELTKFQPGCDVDLSKLRRILRNYSFEVVSNMSDAAVKRIISSNQIGIFVEKIRLKTVRFFFGRTWQSLKRLRLHEILVELLGIPCVVFTKRYVDLYDAASVENTLNQVEIYWNISSVELTLEKLLRASKLMEGEYQCIVCQKLAPCAFRNNDRTSRLHACSSFIHRHCPTNFHYLAVMQAFSNLVPRAFCFPQWKSAKMALASASRFYNLINHI